MLYSCNILTQRLSGKAVAIRLAEDGYDVCINDISANQKGIDEVRAELI
jgi:hypothetical protein